MKSSWSTSELKGSVVKVLTDKELLDYDALFENGIKDVQLRKIETEFEKYKLDL